MRKRARSLVGADECATPDVKAECATPIVKAETPDVNAKCATPIVKAETPAGNATSATPMVALPEISTRAGRKSRSGSAAMKAAMLP